MEEIHEKLTNEDIEKVLELYFLLRLYKVCINVIKEAEMKTEN